MSKHTQRNKKKKEKEKLTLVRNERIIAGKIPPLNLYDLARKGIQSGKLHQLVMDYAAAVKKKHSYDDAVMYAWTRSFGEPP
jgi:hypothetical protein